MPTPLRRQFRDRLVGGVLLALALGVGAWLALSPARVPARPTEAVLLLDETVSLEKGAALLRVRIVGPAPFDVSVTPEPAGAVLDVRVGPAGPAETGAGPDPAHAVEWKARAGEGARRLPGYMSGLHAIRVAPAEGGARAARVRVTRAP